MPGVKRVRAEADAEATLQAIADVLGVTREAVRVTEKKALAKVKRGLQARGIDAEYWLSHLADLHRRQRPHYTVDGSHLFIYCRIEDEAADETCEDEAAE